MTGPRRLPLPGYILAAAEMTALSDWIIVELRLGHAPEVIAETAAEACRGIAAGLRDTGGIAGVTGPGNKPGQ